ncbi:MAG: protein translocase subunit SecD, partial [Verrucomicrobia bacterium]|nr:protein translocase subunit SecD [Verrucomicrobiota bacterium]
ADIVERARKLQAAKPENTFGNLIEAASTNDLTRYFPYKVKGEKNPNLAILYRLQREASGHVKLGLDLQGGVSFLVRMDITRLQVDQGKTNVVERGVDKSVALQNAVEVLRRRVDNLGVAEPLIQPVGEDRILVQLPGLSESIMAEAKKLIQRAAFLEFRIVHPDSADLLKQGFTSFPGYEKLKLVHHKGRPDETTQDVLVKIKPERGLTGKYVKRAGVQRSMTSNEPEIIVRFDDEGAKLFGEATKEHVHHQLAIVLDGELYSAPVIREEIAGGSCQISGDFDLKEAFELASALENPLEAPLKIEDEAQVDPSLGKDTIKAGINSALYGTVLVSIFMLSYYRLSGLIANIALLLNILITFGVMCSIGTTLTLPGIAGIVLTIGMAVDANVLIYERLREELAAGKSMRGAIAAGYDKAFSTILDSHVTTLISAIILIYLGTGTVKGFGVTLTIGVALSLFTALVVTRLIFDWLLARNLTGSLKMMHLIHGTQIDFMRWARIAFIASWTLIGIGVFYGVAIRGKTVLGFELRGGDEVTMEFDKSKKIEDVEKIRAIITKVKVGEEQVKEALIQYQRSPGDNSERLRITALAGSGQKIADDLAKGFPESHFKVSQLRSVGPTLGGEIMRSALLAVVLSLFGILIYVAFRYEFSFAAGAVLAIIHDVLMTLGCYFLAGREINGTVVAAILTIIGFSINDTVV